MPLPSQAAAHHDTDGDDGDVWLVRLMTQAFCSPAAQQTAELLVSGEKLIEVKKAKTFEDFTPRRSLLFART